MADTPKKPQASSKNVVMLDAAERELNAQRKRRTVPLDPPPFMPRGKDNVPAGHWRQDLITGMPADEGCECPVEPIGFEGDLFYFIDSRGQFRAIKAEKVNQVGIQDLFAATPNYPKWMCPRWSKPVMSKDGKTIIKESEIVSFEADDIKEALFLACSRKGFFSPNDKMRGRGSWTFRPPQKLPNTLVYHCGDELWICDKGAFKALPTGVHDGKLYPHLSALPAPWTKPITMAENPGAKLLAGFRRSKWARPDVDPILLLGWIGAAYLGGALNWRPSVLLLGDKGTGKSTLQDVLKTLFGDALFHSSDSTAAGIYQAMGHDSRAVALDEMEPGLDERKASNIADLMRTSASGAIGRRGSAGGTASEFQMRSAFLFSAINNPLHTAADLSRVAVLRMLPFDKGSEKGEPINADTTGPMILAAMMRGWGDGGHGFKMQYDRFAAALAEGGHEKRGQDTYGTLLACAAMLLGDELAAELNVPLGPEEERAWTKLLAAESLPEVEDSKPNYRQCVDRILTSVVRSWRANSTHNTIGQVVHLLRTTDDNGVTVTPGIDRDVAKREINLAGFGLFNTHEIVAGVMQSEGLTLEQALTRFGLPKAGFVLAVPNQSSKVAELLEGTDWQRGGWRDAFQQCTVPGVMNWNKQINRVRIDGNRERCTLIVLDRYHAAPEK